METLQVGGMSMSEDEYRQAVQAARDEYDRTGNARTYNATMTALRQAYHGSNGA